MMIIIGTMMNSVDGAARPEHDVMRVRLGTLRNSSCRSALNQPRRRLLQLTRLRTRQLPYHRHEEPVLDDSQTTADGSLREGRLERA
jgi:hypothetical protein